MGDVLMAQSELTPLEYCRNNPVNAQIICDLLRGITFTRNDDLSLLRVTRYDVGYYYENFGFVLKAEPILGRVKKKYEDIDPPMICITGVNLDRVSNNYNDQEPRDNINWGLEFNGKTEKCKTLLLTMSVIKQFNTRRPVHQIIRNCEYLHDEVCFEKTFITSVKGQRSSIPKERYDAAQLSTAIDHYNLKTIMNEWWPNPPFRTVTPPPSKPLYPRTPRKHAELISMLGYISSDCSYERYRDVVWGILSTGWKDAEKIARTWCMKTPQRFERGSFNTIIKSFNPEHENPITVGSIKHWAREGGWT